MLSPIIMLAGIGIPMVILGVLTGVMKKQRKTTHKLPRGTIEHIKNVEAPIRPPSEIKIESSTPGTHFSRTVCLICLGGLSLLTVLTLIILLIGLWTNIPTILFVDLPVFVNIFGMILLWFVDLWGFSVFYYNVNYTALNLPLTYKYFLATGGPYRVIRHPMYVAKIFQMLALFFLTGLWIFLVPLFVMIALPTQARGEETLLLARFGKDYKDYMQKTGRFWPKFKSIFNE